MDVVTAVTIGLKVLVFLQELEKNKQQDVSDVKAAATVLLDASDSEAEEIAGLLSQVDSSVLHSLVEGVGGILGLLGLFKKKE